jgi:peptidoglycan/xylan/chitin deacetylase (PgdA/CDA1 family)
MGGSLTRALAARLSPRARRRVRRLTDRVLAPVGSLRGVRTGERVVALTYDDGPDPEHTPAVLDALEAAGVRATFFQLVVRAERHPDLVRRIVDGGHEVGLHGVDHARLTTLPVLRVAALLKEGRQRLEAVTGTPVRLFRPAYGSQSLRTLVATRRAGLYPVVWGASTDDWRDGTSEEIVRRVLPRVGPGEIVLLHDGFEQPAWEPRPAPTFDRGKATTILLDALADAGYGAETVGGLLAAAPAWRTAWFRP